MKKSFGHYTISGYILYSNEKNLVDKQTNFLETFRKNFKFIKNLRGWIAKRESLKEPLSLLKKFPLRAGALFIKRESLTAAIEKGQFLIGSAIQVLSKTYKTVATNPKSFLLGVGNKNLIFGTLLSVPLVYFIYKKILTLTLVDESISGIDSLPITNYEIFFLEKSKKSRNDLPFYNLDLPLLALNLSLGLSLSFVFPIIRDIIRDLVLLDKFGRLEGIYDYRYKISNFLRFLAFGGLYLILLKKFLNEVKKYLFKKGKLSQVSMEFLNALEGSFILIYFSYHLNSRYFYLNLMDFLRWLPFFIKILKKNSEIVKLRN